MTLPAAVALAGLAASAVVYAVAAAELQWLRRTARGAPVPRFAPPISILKPLSGLDERLEESLDSFYRLDYPNYEIVFSFSASSDPAYPIARRVADCHARVPSVFVFDGRDSGGNAKVDRLAAAAERARHRLLLCSDGNVGVRPDFLARAVSHFADPRVGLVSHLFAATGASSAASRVEALFLNGCLLPGTAAVAGILGMSCVVGKSILVSRAALEEIGGFPALQNFLAEDYLIGREVRRAGYRVVLSADVLDTAEVSKTARAVWARHRRWAMMRRRLGGPLYLVEAFSGALPWAIAAAAAGAWAPAAALLSFRYAAEARVAASFGRPHSLSDWLLMPVRDLAAAGIFVAGLAGRSVRWRGRPLSIGEDTRIIRRTVRFQPHVS
ncbi:MAG TPA: glycosyltransferase [Thermoanaerobaculia bacterium]|nr:glycosyltransferase [Thermoanaerobaculia bacterium]